MKHWLQPLVLTIIFLSTVSLAQADDAELRKWTIGATYAGVGVGYRFSPRWSTELRAQAAKDVFVGGVRGNFHLHKRWGLYPYFGIEADYTSFEGEATKGKGFATEMFLGAEYYFKEVWSAVLDAGPAFISIEDNDTGESVSGVQGVINIGINYHFGRSVK